MAEAVVTWKLTASESRVIRAALESRADDAHEAAREFRGENPRLSTDLSNESKALKNILEKI